MRTVKPERKQSERNRRNAILALTICAAGYGAACSSGSSSPGGNATGDPGNGGDGGGGGAVGDAGGTSASGNKGDGGGALTDSGGTSAPISQQCTDLATAFCKIEAQCDTSDMQGNFAGSQTDCVARTVFGCPSVTETGTSTTPASIASCATALGQLSGCAAFAGYLQSTNGTMCPLKPGTLASGTACNDDSQCSGGLCGESASSNCPVCQAKPTLPLCAESSDCPSGQLCNWNGTCVVPGGMGAVCDDSDPGSAVQPCGPLLYCAFPASSGDVRPAGAGDAGAADAGAVDAGVTDAGSVTGSCTPLGTTGTPCNVNDDVNDCADGLFCNNAGQCAQIAWVQDGGACDDVGLLCAGSYCDFTSPDANADGVCTPFVGDGAACQFDEQCAFNAFCPSGTCVTTAPVCN